MHRLITGLVVVCVALFALAGVSVAHNKFYGSAVRGVEVAEEGSTVTISGSVRSGYAPCKRFRPVDLVNRSGDRVTRVRADGRGNFQIEVALKSVPKDSYSVQAVRKRLAPRTRRHRHFCRPAKASAGVFGEGRPDKDRGHGGRPPRGH